MMFVVVVVVVDDEVLFVVVLLLLLLLLLLLDEMVVVVFAGSVASVVLAAAATAVCANRSGYCVTTHWTVYSMRSNKGRILRPPKQGIQCHTGNGTATAGIPWAVNVAHNDAKSADPVKKPGTTTAMGNQSSSSSSSSLLLSVTSFGKSLFVACLPIGG